MENEWIGKTIKKKICSQKILKKLTIKVKKPLAREQIFCRTPFSSKTKVKKRTNRSFRKNSRSLKFNFFELKKKHKTSSVKIQRIFID